VEKIRG